MPNGVTFDDVKKMSEEEFRTLYAMNYSANKERFDRIERKLESIDSKLDGLIQWKISMTTKIIVVSGAVGAIVSVLLRVLGDRLFGL